MFDLGPSRYIALGLSVPKIGKPRRAAEVCTCAICHRSGVTLLKREGTYVCRPCYGRLLDLRKLEEQQKEREEP